MESNIRMLRKSSNEKSRSLQAIFEESDYACVGILEEGREERGKVVVAGVDLEIEIPP